MNENNSHKPNIRLICAGYKHTVGLNSDGTVFAIGLNTYGQCSFGEWHDIIEVAAANAHTGNGHTVSLRTEPLSRLGGTSTTNVTLMTGMTSSPSRPDGGVLSQLLPIEPS